MIVFFILNTKMTDEIRHDQWHRRTGEKARCIEWIPIEDPVGIRDDDALREGDYDTDPPDSFWMSACLNHGDIIYNPVTLDAFVICHNAYAHCGSMYNDGT